MSVGQDVKKIFEELASEIAPRPDALPRARDRVAHRQKRIAAATASLVVLALAAAIVLLPRIQRPGPSITVDRPTGTERSGWQLYRDGEAGWSLRYPRTWNLQRDDYIGFEMQDRGVLVTNLNHDLQRPNPTVDQTYSTNYPDLRHVPDSFVGLWFFKIVGAHTGDNCGDYCAYETRFPLTINRMKQLRAEITDQHGGPPAQTLTISHKGQDAYALWVWFGAKASKADRSAVGRIVSSIAFDCAECRLDPWPTYREPLSGVRMEYPPGVTVERVADPSLALRSVVFSSIKLDDGWMRLRVWRKDDKTAYKWAVRHSSRALPPNRGALYFRLNTRVNNRINKIVWENSEFAPFIYEASTKSVVHAAAFVTDSYAITLEWSARSPATSLVLDQAFHRMIISAFLP